MSKFRNKPQRIDGLYFASKREAAVYQELKLLERAGKINGIVCQHKLDLHTTDPKGIKRKIGSHKVDFSYHDCEKKERVWLECKGFDHADGRMRRKHVETEYGIKINLRT